METTPKRELTLTEIQAREYLIAIDPNDPAPYNTLKQLYPDAASRPQRVTQLLQQGAQNTGDASLAQ